VLRDFEGNPISNAHLEFHEYTKGKGKFVASPMTDTSGVADVSSLKGGLRMSVESERVPANLFLTPRETERRDSRRSRCFIGSVGAI
jgi:hypothetical protein